MELKDIGRIGVIGAGLMGHGIAQVFASAGYDVNLYDADKATLEAAKGKIEANFKPFIALGLAKPEDVAGCLDRISLCPSLEALCKGPQYIIEAILEDLESEEEGLRRGRAPRGPRCHFLEQHLGHQHHRDRGGPEKQGALPGDPLLEPAPGAALRGGDPRR